MSKEKINNKLHTRHICGSGGEMNSHKVELMFLFADVMTMETSSRVENTGEIF
jgi:hypothetical protein